MYHDFMEKSISNNKTINNKENPDQENNKIERKIASTPLNC